MIYQHGPTGQYIAGHAILSPEVMRTIDYKDKHPITGQAVHFIFNGVEFSYFDTLQARVKKIDLPLTDYEQFFKLIAKEKGIKTISEQDIKLFSIGFPATLTITTRVDSPVIMPATRVFQIIQLVETDYFRVKLHEENGAGEWIYFYRPHIYKEIMHLFTQPVGI